MPTIRGVYWDIEDGAFVRQHGHVKIVLRTGEPGLWHMRFSFRDWLPFGEDWTVLNEGETPDFSKAIRLAREAADSLQRGVYAATQA